MSVPTKGKKGVLMPEPDVRGWRRDVIRFTCQSRVSAVSVGAKSVNIGGVASDVRVPVTEHWGRPAKVMEAKMQCEFYEPGRRGRGDVTCDHRMCWLSDHG